MSQQSVTMYGLSTCMHCKRAREYMEGRKVPFHCIYVDKLEGEERADTLGIVRKHNPRLSFPTIVIDNGKSVIVGFQQAQLDTALGLA